MKQSDIILAMVLSLCVFGIASATTPWIPIVKDGQEGTYTVSANNQPAAVNLVGSSPVAFHYLRDQVKAATLPETVEKRVAYGAYGTRKALSAFSDDWLPTSENDYLWQERSPIYYNPHMDYYWGFQSRDLEGDYGGEWWTTNPGKYDEWYDNTLSWDQHTRYLDLWANQEA